MAAVRSLCHHGVLLENGRIKKVGEIYDVVDYYLSSNENKEINVFKPQKAIRQSDNPNIIIQNLELVSCAIQTGKPLSFELTIKNTSVPIDCEIAIAIKKNENSITQFFSKDMGFDITLGTGENRVIVSVPECPITEGDYSLNLWVGSNNRPLDWIQDCFWLHVNPGELIPNHTIENRGYPITVKSSWNVNKK